MTDPRYFINFAPADAVQYDGTNAQECSDAIGYSGTPFVNDRCVVLTSFGRQSLAVRPGQWLVWQGDRVWVQDEEPAMVERWEWAARQSYDETVTPLHSEQSARQYAAGVTTVGRPGYTAVKTFPRTLMRRPVVRTPDGSLWTGPWVPVEGGAE